MTLLYVVIYIASMNYRTPENVYPHDFANQAACETFVTNELGATHMRLKKGNTEFIFRCGVST